MCQMGGDDKRCLGQSQGPLPVDEAGHKHVGVVCGRTSLHTCIQLCTAITVANSIQLLVKKNIIASLMSTKCHVLSALHILTHLILTRTPKHRYSYLCPIFLRHREIKELGQDCTASTQ